MSKHKFYHMSRSGKLTQLASLDNALAAMEKDGFLWLDYYQPTDLELAVLIEPLDLHPLAVEDCLDENQIPKIDDYPHHTFLLFNAFKYADDVLSISEVDAFIGKNFLVTVSGCDSKNQPILKNFENAVNVDIEDARQGPAFLLHTLLDYIVDQKFIAIEALGDQMDGAEELILADHSHFNPADLLHLRRDLLTCRKSLFHEREILTKICRKDCSFIPAKAIYVYRDIYDHLSKFFELIESLRDVVTSLMEMYLSLLNNQMAKAANDTNITIRRLTLITTVFMPLSFLAGIGGMSEWSMMTGPQNWRIAYPAFLLTMVVIGIISYFLIKWLEKKDQKHSTHV
jgi:magnesium transporter